MRFWPACLVLLLMSDHAIAAPSNASKLVGIWELRGGTCESDNVVTYRANGSFDTYDTSGRWSLNGAKLTSLITKRGDPDERARSIVPAEKHITTIISLTNDSMTERRADGTIHHLRRCR